MEHSHSGLSFSFGPDMKQDDLLKAAKLLFEVVAKLKRYSEKL